MGVDSAYYKAMVDRVKYALELNPSNIFLGTLWIQGEHDYSKSAEHLSKFDEMTVDFFNKMNGFGLGSRVKKGVFDKDSWFNVEASKYWKTLPGYNAILENYKQWNQATYVEIPMETETNAENGTGLTTSNRESHFGNNAYRTVIAPAVFEKMKSQNTLLSR